MVTVYVYGLDLISQIRGEEQDFYHVDGLGSTRALTDETGNVTDTYDYEAFGKLVDSSGESENDYLFAGEQFDGDLGQYYLRQRYYEQGIGRFTRRDTYEGRIGEPLTLHKYLYANADPVNGIDPSGFVTLAEISAARSIRNTLAGIQLDSYSYLINVTIAGGDYDTENVARDFDIELASTAAFLLLNITLKYLLNAFEFSANSIRVNRVESEANARIFVGEAGEVLVQGDGTLFFNFGQRARAEEFLKRRSLQYPETPSRIKSFEVPKSYVDDLRASAVRERQRKKFPDRPLRVDPKHPDQYGLVIERLRRIILQGTGIVE